MPEKSFHTFSDRNDIQAFDHIIINPNIISQPGGSQFKWEKNAFDLRDIGRYNEFNYFYDFVREVLYDTGEALHHDRSGTRSLLRHYSFQFGETDLRYKISAKWKESGEVEEKDYDLKVDDIHLNIYKTGVGVLSFFLTNEDENQKSKEDILRINQFGRRIYPPFFEVDQEKIINYDLGEAFEQQLKGTQNKELSCEIGIEASIGHEDGSELGKQRGGKPFSALETFKDYFKSESFSKGPFRLPKFIIALFPEGIFVTTEKERGDQTSYGKIFLSPVLDDRMFVVCWYGNDDLANAMRPTTTPNHHGDLERYFPYKKVQDPHYHYARPYGNFWHEFTFVDNPGGLSSQNPYLTEELLDKHTYQRWVGYGTYYGITRYSLVCLTSSFETLKKDPINAAFLVQHLQSIYYKMTELVLVQRASLLKFSDEITHLSHFSPKKGNQIDVSLLSTQIQDLYKHYILYVNKIYYREITAQEQGIEMYNMMQKHMSLEQHTKELDHEIEELHKYLGALEEDAQNQKLNGITIIGALFLIPSFILALYGLKIYEPFTQSMQAKDLMLITLGMLFLGGCSIAGVGIWVKNRLWRGLLALSGFAIAGLLIFGPLYTKEKALPKNSSEITLSPTTPSSSVMESSGDSLSSDSVNTPGLENSLTTSPSDTL
ncbi:MAG: hypothetical protein AAFR61_29005 [Bacteroidota bacterium]